MPVVSLDVLNFCCLASAFKLLPSKDAETSIWNAWPFDTPFWRPAYGHIWWYRWKCEDIVCFFLPLKNVKVCCLSSVFLGSVSIKCYWAGNASGVFCVLWPLSSVYFSSVYVPPLSPCFIKYVTYCVRAGGSACQVTEVSAPDSSEDCWFLHFNSPASSWSMY